VSRWPLAAVVAGSLFVTVGLNVWGQSTLPTASTTGAPVTSDALYCAGLTNDPGGFTGEVTFVNTADQPRALALSIVGGGVHGTTMQQQRMLAPHQLLVVYPNALEAGRGTVYAVAAQVSGGGVVGEELTRHDQAEAPCTSAGATQWTATGLSTLVGTTSRVVLYNPTATAAVFNVTAFTTNGFVQPAKWQGLTVGPQSIATVDLGSQLVGDASFGATVTVVRGSLVMVADQQTKGEDSLLAGSTGATSTLTFPLVPTAEGATATITLSNPSETPASVSLHVALANYTVPGRSLVVAPYATTTFRVTPNTAIPASGEAVVTVQSSTPLVGALSTGTTGRLRVQSALAPASSWVLADVTGGGFPAVTLSNTGAAPATVTVTAGPLGQAGVATTLTVPGSTTQTLIGRLTGVASWRSVVLTVTSPSSSLVLAATGHSVPAGILLRIPLQRG